MCHNMMIRRDNRQKTRCESKICHRNDQLEDFQPSILLLIDFYDTIGKFHAIEHDIVINAWAIGAICHATATMAVWEKGAFQDTGTKSSHIFAWTNVSSSLVDNCII